MFENAIKEFSEKNKVVLKIKVNTKAPKTKLKSVMEDGTYKLDVTAAPEKGKANKEIINFLSKIFKTSKNNIKILSGETSKLKIIEVKK